MAGAAFAKTTETSAGSPPDSPGGTASPSPLRRHHRGAAGDRAGGAPARVYFRWDSGPEKGTTATARAQQRSGIT